MSAADWVFFGVGIGLILVCLYLAFRAPIDAGRLLILRLVLCVAAALVGGSLPGALRLDVQWQDIGIRATGAIAFGLIFWLVDPGRRLSTKAQARPGSAPPPPTTP
jgi:hypothetical protein